jgi:hypothetical protein
MSRKRVIIAVMVMLLAVGLAVSACKPSGPSLDTDKKAYAPGEMINVTFSAPAGLPTNAWVGIIPSEVPHGDEAQNDTYDLTYQYLNGVPTGTLVFSAPVLPGTYDFRMNDSDSNGKEIASVTFSVK